MLVFIGWSGKKSAKVASALYKWLPFFFETAVVWYSSESIDVGKEWSKELKAVLKKADIGVFCLTKSNQESAWMKQEFKKLRNSPRSPRIISYRIGLRRKKLQGKFSKYQSPKATKKDTLMLVQHIAKCIPRSKRSDRDLSKLFKILWPELKSTFDKL